MRTVDYIAKFLISKKIREIFMLTGYGAMYLNDAIQQSGIKHYASRNEAAAPMMASAYGKIKGPIGAVCVTAGPGATNALPGLAEAWVDSAPIMIFSGQVEKKHTTHHLKINNLRTYGTAEINIIDVVKPITKFSAVVDNPNKIKYLLEKSFYIATSGRPGPVWLDIPLDIQRATVDPSKLKRFFITKKSLFNKKKELKIKIIKIIKLLRKSKSPLIVCGQGVRQSKAIEEFKKIVNVLKVPVVFSRLGQDIIPHNQKYIFGLSGIKGTRFCKSITQKSDVVLVLGSRLAVPFIGYKSEAFSKKAKIIMVDIDSAELKKPLKLAVKINLDLKDFLIEFKKELKKEKLPSYKNWINYCEKLKRDHPMVVSKMKKNPIDLYYFMQRLGKISSSKSVLISDAGSNYYIGGQVWGFEKSQRELTSGSNAAMGLSIPLSIGASVSSPTKNIFAVTGDGSLELNIQELKTISHYKLNIKLFVINNGGFVSMINWQDTIFKGRRLDTKESTGYGSLNLKKIAEAFDMKWTKISDFSKIDETLKKLNKTKGPIFVEVITSNQQKIVDSFGYFT